VAHAQSRPGDRCPGTDDKDPLEFRGRRSVKSQHQFGWDKQSTAIVESNDDLSSTAVVPDGDSEASHGRERRPGILLSVTMGGQPGVAGWREPATPEPELVIWSLWRPPRLFKIPSPALRQARRRRAQPPQPSSGWHVTSPY
jgi:hypothetical protein